jgi:mRNA interferase MazF
VLCDYSTGFRPPEMVKRRPCVVISARLPYRDRLCTVVPLSATPPAREVAYQCRIELAEALPPPFEQQLCWAKADMLATVGFGRLIYSAVTATGRAAGGVICTRSSRRRISSVCWNASFTL